MTGFKIPLDAYVVGVPMAYACCALAGLVVKTLTADPEMSTLSYYDKPESEVGKVGQNYNNSVRDLFLNRIARHRVGVFNNDIEVSPK